MKCVSRFYLWLNSSIFVLLLVLPPSAVAVSADVYKTPARWTDEGGKTFTLDNLRGKKSVFALFYTSCKAICPMTVKSLKKLESALSGVDKSDLQVVLVTIDPKTDGPEKIQTFMKEQKISGWKVLSGDPVDTKGLAGALGIGFAEKPVNQNFHNMHSLSLVVVNKDGSVAGQLPVASADLKEFKKLLKN